MNFPRISVRSIATFSESHFLLLGTARGHLLLLHRHRLRFWQRWTLLKERTKFCIWAWWTPHTGTNTCLGSRPNLNHQWICDFHPRISCLASSFFASLSFFRRGPLFHVFNSLLCIHCVLLRDNWLKILIQKTLQRFLN
mgnify:CR=1 FL=1